MLIATLEALDRVRVGERVNVDGTPWERVSEGFKAGEQVLPLVAFQGFADARKIRTPDDPALTLPLWKTDRRGRAYLAVEEDPVTGGIIVVTMPRDDYLPTITVMDPGAVQGLIDLSNPPTWSSPAWTQVVGKVVEYLRPASVFTGISGGVSRGLLDDLYAMAPDVEGLDEVLVKHNVGRQRTGQVTVEAEGTSTVTAGLLGDGIEVDEVEVPWRFGYQFPVSAPITAPCLCGAFDQEQYNSRLPVNMVKESHKVTCSEPDCINKKE